MMGTFVNITIYHYDQTVANEAIFAAFSELSRIEKLFSSYQVKSDVSRLNDLAFKYPVTVSEETYALLQKSVAFSKQNGGFFDITVGKVVDLWGFRTLENQHVPNATAFRKEVNKVGFDGILFLDSNRISFAQDFAITLGGHAKGYAVDMAKSVLLDYDIESFLINAGGDMIAHGVKPNQKHWEIGIQHPRADSIIQRVKLNDMAIATSGDYERYFIENGQRYHHIFNPKTGYPSSHFQSVTVIHESAEMADILATSIFVSGPDHIPAETIYFTIRQDGQTQMSPSFKAYLKK